MRIEDRYTKSLSPPHCLPWHKSLLDRSLVKSLTPESTPTGRLCPSKEDVWHNSLSIYLLLNCEGFAPAVPNRRLKRGPMAVAAEAASPSSDASRLRAVVREPSGRWRGGGGCSCLAASALSSPSAAAAGTGNASSRRFGPTTPPLRPNESEREDESLTTPMPPPLLLWFFGVTLHESGIWEGFF